LLLKSIGRPTDASFHPIMASETKNIPKPTPMERLQLGGLLFVTILTRIFFLDMGFGGGDSWRVGITGKLWVESGEYLPSRPPGFPMTEMVSALSYKLFGISPLTWIATNSVSMLMCCVAIWGVWALAKKWQLKNPILIASIFAFVPLVWVYSVQTIDYIWYTALMLLALNVFESDTKNAHVKTGLILGLAASARFFGVLFLIPIFILSWMRYKSIRKLLEVLLSFVIVTLCAYAIIFSQISDWGEYREWFDELNMIRAGLADIEGGWFRRALLLPVTRLYGPLASIAVVIAHIIALPKIVKCWKDKDPAVIIPVLFSTVIMVPYLWHMHPYYWIPATGFMLIILSRTLNHKIFMVVAILILAANIPWWQNTIEQPKFLAPHGNNPIIEAVSREIGQFQCMNVFEESAHVQYIMTSILDHLDHRTGDDWVIMANIRFPVVQFMIPGIQRIDLDVNEGNAVSVWGIPGDHSPGANEFDESFNIGATYKYMLSPDHVRRLVESGYHVIWLPGMENTYYASYGVPINEVEGVEILFEN